MTYLFELISNNVCLLFKKIEDNPTPGIHIDFAFELAFWSILSSFLCIFKKLGGK